MLKGIEFIREKSRGKVEGCKELSSPAPVILGRDAQSVPKILWQQVSKLVNKLAILLQRSMFTQDSRDKPENDGCWGRLFGVCCKSVKYPSPADKSATSPSGGEVLNSVFSASTLNVILRRYSLPEVPRRRIHNVIAYAMSICVAFSNKVVDSPAWHSLWGVPLKNDVLSWCFKCLLDYCCKFFKYPSPEANVSTSPSGGEVGRSMIEMLGVLAIIAVLSVGGIAGYSKAMEMWKVTKLKTRLAELFLQCVNLKDDLVRQYQNGAVSSGSLPVAQIMTAMDVVPEGLKLNTPNSFKDVDNNSFSFYFQYVKNSNLIEYLIIFSIYNADGYNSQKQKFCETFIEQAKAISPYVSLVYKRGYKDTTFQGYSQKAIDFRSANPAEISSFCKECDAEYSCHLHLRFKTNGL